MKKILFPTFLFFASLSTLILITVCFAKIPRPSDRPVVRAFIDEMVKKHQFSKDWLTQLLDSTRTRPDIILAMDTPHEAKPWFKYRPVFISPARAQEGVLFWKQHAETLDRALKTYGIPPQVIVAILGVESHYGKNKGRYPVIESLTTLAFDYPRRAKYFREELEAFLLLTREQKIDPNLPLGSYAGAMGQPQFMPSSYRDYAVHFSGVGTPDLVNNTDDVIGSIANYFNQHGWIPGKPIAVEATVRQPLKSNENTGATPKLTVDQFSKLGVKPVTTVAKNELAALLAFDNDKYKEYWLGFNNFYVITRYNTSVNYAMAVHQLAQTILALKEQAP